VHERDVRRGLDEGAVGQHALLDQPRPPLQADEELLVDGDGLGDVDLIGIGVHRRVVGLAQRRVPRPGVVPLVGGLGAHPIQLLHEADLPLGMQQLHHQPDRHAHDAAADDQRVHLLHLLARRERNVLRLTEEGVVSPAGREAERDRLRETTRLRGGRRGVGAHATNQACSEARGAAAQHSRRHRVPRHRRPHGLMGLR